MAFADEYQGVEAHGNTKLHVIHTNDKKQMAITMQIRKGKHQVVTITLAQYEHYLSIQRHKIVGIDLEYNNEPEATHKPALCKLSIGKKHPVLLFQLSAAERCTIFDNFLADPRLERVNLEVANFVDIQKEWRVPKATKELDSLGDVSGMLIDDYYNNVKKKITDDEHKH
ncbi:uncharacterized protein [Aegilops tauschii subsp. strangulata]|uniref:uncharacterized protein n=1 Tax=Aegilops tauschii subsp. strangulata TaxID=200361 RepID=UPI003CC89348